MTAVRDPNLHGLQRFAKVVCPPRQREWIDALLSEAYLSESSRHSREWVRGAVLMAFRARLALVMGRLHESVRLFPVLLSLSFILFGLSSILAALDYKLLVGEEDALVYGTGLATLAFLTVAGFKGVHQAASIHQSLGD